MKRIALLLVAIAMVAGAVAAWAQTSTRTEVKPAPQSALKSAKEIRGASPYLEVENEPPPKLIVDEPLPEGLAQGIVWIQWRVENLQVVPVFGKGAVNVSPRVGHLHVHVDDVGWWWADPSGINTVDIAGLSEGPHKVRLELVNTNHEPFPGQSKTVTFTIPKGASLSLRR
jgi:Family of unknown function (DUF6130)